MMTDEQARHDHHIERLVRIEEGVKSLGKSMDTLRGALSDHYQEEKRLAEKVDIIERDIASLQGGYKVFLKMCAVGVIVSGVIWSAATWVAGK